MLSLDSQIYPIVVTLYTVVGFLEWVSVSLSFGVIQRFSRCPSGCVLVRVLWLLCACASRGQWPGVWDPARPRKGREMAVGHQGELFSTSGHPGAIASQRRVFKIY